MHMANLQIKMTEEQCRDWVDKVFTNTLGKGIDYVIEAVKEKMIREGEIDEESVSEFQTEDISDENENENDDKTGDK